ncbi:MAG: HEAT repeat domain-containing protein [Limisphaerales bacterium]
MNTHPPRWFPRLSILLAVVLLGEAVAAGPVAALQEYRAGQNRDVLTAVEAAVRAALGTPDAAGVEAELIAVLESSATPEAKDFACRQLRAIGSDRSVPALAGLLADPWLTSLARYALEPMSGPVARNALLSALESLEGEPLVGVIQSLGVRGEEESVTPLSARLSSADPVVVKATITALGRIGGEVALEWLRVVAVNFEASAGDGGLSTELRLTDAAKAEFDLGNLADALVRCADGFARSGNEFLAGEIYGRTYEAGRLPFAGRMAGLRGLAALNPDQTVPLLMEILRGDDGDAQAVVLGLLRRLPVRAAGQVLAGAEAFKPAVLAQVVMAIGERGEPSATPALIRLSNHADPAVRRAAIEALGAGEGVAVSIDRLLTVGASGSELARTAALESLRRVRGPVADELLVGAVPQGDPAVRSTAIRAVAARGLKAALPALVQSAGQASMPVRMAAFEALASLGGAAEQTVLLDRVLKAGSDVERDAAARALGTLLRRIPANETGVKGLIDSLTAAPPAAKPALFDCLAQVGGPTALGAVVAAAKEGDSEVRGAAINTLAGWPDPAPMNDLLAIARATENPVHRTVALRGFVQFIGQPDRTPEQRLGQFQQALEVAQRADEKRLVLGGLGTLSDPGALRLAESMLDEVALKNEAGLATAQIARGLASTHPVEARAAADRVLATAPADSVTAQAREVINYLERTQDFVTAWQLAGPYTRDGASERELFDLAFPPESAEGTVAWRTIAAEGGLAQLDRLVGGDNRVAYLRVSVISPTARQARLEMGSDDGLKVWLNGRLVHANNVNRGYAAGDDQVVVDFQPGANRLLVKVTQGGGGWATGVRVRAADGSKIEGLHFKTE